MTLVPSVRSRRFVQDHKRAAGLAAVVVEGTALRLARLAPRSSVSLNHRDIILASVFGAIGFVALVALIFLLVRCMRRQNASDDMILERPTSALRDTQDTSTYQNAAFSTPNQNVPISPSALGTPYSPDRAYIPNHPYAVTYSRDPRNSFPSSPPPRITTVQPLPALTISHPYTQSGEPQQQEHTSARPSTLYESFLSTESQAPTPEPPMDAIEPMEPSPLASTIGGAMSHHVAQFDTGLSRALSEAPSSMSASSSAPLQPRNKQPPR